MSLTEAPEAEIPVAKALVEICDRPAFERSGDGLKGCCSSPCIVADLSGVEVFDEGVSRELDFSVGRENDPVLGNCLHAGGKAPELLYTETLGPEFTKLPGDTFVIVPLALFDMAHVYNRHAVAALCTVGEYMQNPDLPEGTPVYVQVESVEELDEALAEKLGMDKQAVLVLSLGVDYHACREAFRLTGRWGLDNRTLLRLVLRGTDTGHLGLEAAAQVGGLFLDRLPGGLWLSAPEVPGVSFPLELARNILQSAGVRRYKAEFISCPGCGRTLFDLQGAVAKVKAAFGHLNTLKIAVMGCVVNGPGEMGDADFGYVAAGNGKVNLYKGRKMVRAGIPETEAIEALRELIENGI